MELGRSQPLWRVRGSYSTRLFLSLFILAVAFCYGGFRTFSELEMTYLSIFAVLRSLASGVACHGAWSFSAVMAS